MHNVYLDGLGHLAAGVVHDALTRAELCIHWASIFAGLVPRPPGCPSLDRGELKQGLSLVICESLQMLEALLGVKPKSLLTPSDIQGHTMDGALVSMTTPAKYMQ